jgi:hypothetical protein
MPKTHWKIDDIPWDTFEPQKLDSEHLKIVKAAAMVEFNAIRYQEYLCRVFSNDPIFQRAAKYWATEEVQHGQTLGRYAQLADPSFDFKAAFERFTAGYNIDASMDHSVRGSHAAELIARCIVEVGTSSYYTALSGATNEPLLKAICHNIATDEFRHYSMFYSHLQGYLHTESLSRLQRLKVSWSRIREVEDDELAYAYYAANASREDRYEREKFSSAYKVRAFPLYKPAHIRHMIAMVAKASGLSPHAFWHGPASHAMLWFMNKQAEKARSVFM